MISNFASTKIKNIGQVLGTFIDGLPGIEIRFDLSSDKFDSVANLCEDKLLDHLFFHNRIIFSGDIFDSDAMDSQMYIMNYLREEHLEIPDVCYVIGRESALGYLNGSRGLYNEMLYRRSKVFANVDRDFDDTYSECIRSMIVNDSVKFVFYSEANKMPNISSTISKFLTIKEFMKDKPSLDHYKIVLEDESDLLGIDAKLIYESGTSVSSSKIFGIF